MIQNKRDKKMGAAKMKSRYALATLAMLLTTTQASMAQEALSWWYEQASPEQQTLITKNIVEPFEAANSDYDLKVDYRGSELDKQLRVAMLSGTGPDLVYTAGPSYVAPMAQSGQLLALDDYATQLGWNDRILPVFLEMGRYDGKLYALPKTYETLGLFYNKTLFAKKGWDVPKTTEEVEALADKMLAEGIIPFSAGNANWRPANEHYVSIALNSIAGPDVIYKALAGQIPWTDPAIRAAVERLNSWWEKGYFGADYFSLTDEQAVAMMASGKAGMMPTGTWQFQNVGKYFPENKAEAGFIGFPSPDGQPGPIFALGVGSTFSVAATSKSPDAAAEAIDFIFSPQTYEEMNKSWPGEWNMPLSDLSSVKLGDSQTLYSEAMANLADTVDKGQYGYTTWTFLPPATNSYLVSGIEEVWLDKISVDDFLANLDERFMTDKEAGKVPPTPAR